MSERGTKESSVTTKGTFCERREYAALAMKPFVSSNTYKFFEQNKEYLVLLLAKPTVH